MFAAVREFRFSQQEFDRFSRSKPTECAFERPPSGIASDCRYDSCYCSASAGDPSYPLPALARRHRPCRPAPYKSLASNSALHALAIAVRETVMSIVLPDERRHSSRSRKRSHVFPFPRSANRDSPCAAKFQTSLARAKRAAVCAPSVEADDPP